MTSVAACLTKDPSHEEVLLKLTGFPGKKLTAQQFHKMKAAFLKGYEWDQNSTIKIGFLQQAYKDESGQMIDPNYTTYKADFVRQIVDSHIGPLVNLNFEWNADPQDADVRISFSKGPGGQPGSSYSYIGTQCRDSSINKEGPTMNLGWLDDEQDYDSPDFAGTGIVILHEFGHMLGMIHEHSRADANLQWNKPVIYKLMAGPPNNWNKQTVDEQVFDTVPVDSFNGSVYDKSSMMHYIFPASWFLVDPHLPEVTKMSPLDIEWISKTYPRKENFLGVNVVVGGKKIGNFTIVLVLLLIAVLVYLYFRKNKKGRKYLVL